MYLKMFAQTKIHRANKVQGSQGLNYAKTLHANPTIVIIC